MSVNNVPLGFADANKLFRAEYISSPTYVRKIASFLFPTTWIAAALPSFAVSTILLAGKGNTTLATWMPDGQLELLLVILLPTTHTDTTLFQNLALSSGVKERLILVDKIEYIVDRFSSMQTMSLPVQEVAQKQLYYGNALRVLA